MKDTILFDAAKGWFHAPCGKYFKYYAPTSSRWSGDTWLSHSCEALTVEALLYPVTMLANTVRSQSARLARGE